MSIDKKIHRVEDSGRPTFALELTGGQEKRLIVWELLSESQSKGRKQRFERANKEVNIKNISEALNMKVLENSDYLWKNWKAVRVGSVSEERRRVLFNRMLEHYVEVDELEDKRYLLVSEPVGIRISVTIVSIQRLTKLDTMRSIIEGVSSMSDDECYYWHALCRSPSSLNGKRALRTLYEK